MDPQQVVSNDCETQKDYIDDARLKKMMKETQPSFMERYGSCLVTFVLIAINVVVFGIEVVLNGFNPDISSLVLFDMGAMFAPAIQGQGDLYRFVTPMFLHVDVMHLLFNMAALYSAGVLLEYLLGRWNFLLLYFIGGITGNVVSYLTDTVMGTYGVSAGASTSIFGLFVAIALLGVLSKKNRAFLSQYSKGMLSVIGLNIAYAQCFVKRPFGWCLGRPYRNVHGAKQKPTSSCGSSCCGFGFMALFSGVSVLLVRASWVAADSLVLLKIGRHGAQYV